MPSGKASVLVVDDDIYLLRMVQRILQMGGYRVLTASGGESAINTFAEASPDLVLLDIMMPGMDGYTVCRRLREFSAVPIIMVTARDSEEEKVRGLDDGADDYVVKPFSAGELAARVRANLRRIQWGEKKTAPAFQSGMLTVDFAARRVTMAGTEIRLTATEYRILSYLAHNAGMILTPAEILNKVWGSEYTGENHILQVNIARLRKRIGDETENPKYILTKPGMGYLLVKQTT